MTYEVIIALAVFALVASITPGPNNLMVMASGANYGFKRTVPHWSGIIIGFFIMVVLVGVGLMQMFTAYPVTYLLLKSASVVYLLFLAWKVATAAPLRDDAQPTGKPFTLLQAVLFQWVNPKAWAMALSALSAYTPPSHPLSSVFVVAIMFSLVNLPSQALWIFLGTQLRRFLDEPIKLRVFNISMAVLLVASLYPILFAQ